MSEFLPNKRENERAGRIFDKRKCEPASRVCVIISSYTHQDLLGAANEITTLRVNDVCYLS